MAAVRDAVREALRGMAVEELVQQSVADVRARLETEMGEDAVREALGENESVLEEWIVEYADEAMGSAGDPDATPTEAGDGDVASADAVPEEEPAPQADADADGDEDADADEDEKDDDDGVGSLSAESEDGELGNAVLRSNVLAVGTSTKALVETLSIPPHPMLWWVTAIQRWLNYQLVPGRVAEAVYGRRFTAIDRLGFALIFALIRVQYKLLPEWVRFVTPYHVMVQRLVAPYSPLRSFLVNTVATVAHSLMVAFLQPRDPQVVKEVLERAKIDVGKIKWGA